MSRDKKKDSANELLAMLVNQVMDEEDTEDEETDSNEEGNKKLIKKKKKRESESTLEKFNKKKKTSKSDARKEAESPAGADQENNWKPRVPRPQCVICARSYNNPGELHRHEKLVREYGWRTAGCKASGKLYTPV